MSNKHKKYRPEFKAKVALVSLRNELTIFELSQIFGVHLNTIFSWKKRWLKMPLTLLTRVINLAKKWKIKKIKSMNSNGRSAK